MRRWSRDSRRSVPIQRSAMAFALGARAGVRRMRMSEPANTASKAAVNLLSRSRIKNRNWPCKEPQRRVPRRHVERVHPDASLVADQAHVTGVGAAVSDPLRLVETEII